MWTYNDNEYDETPEEYQGFVYVITELDTDKKYIGKKFFWKPKTLPITKKRKRRVKTRVESDWRKYYGSSKEVQQLLEMKGSDNFKRVILRLSFLLFVFCQSSEKTTKKTKKKKNQTPTKY